jgi:type I restriction enzyme S subunit
LRFRAHAGVSNKFASYLFRHCQQTGVFARIALQTTSVAISAVQDSSDFASRGQLRPNSASSLQH